MPRTRRILVPALCAATLAAGCGGADAASGPVYRSTVIGTSVRGVPIRAVEVGNPAATRRVLVVGCLHGDETAGRAITYALARQRPANLDLWIVHNMNPDGCAAHTRGNAHGVDLNRNSTFAWRPLHGFYYSGPRPLSEPESRAARSLILRLRPDVTIWFHQHARLVDLSGGSVAIERAYAQAVGLPLRFFGRPPGSITSWQNRWLRPATAFVVELPAGPVYPAGVARHVRAVLAAGTPAAASAAPPPAATTAATTSTTTTTAPVLRRTPAPAIRQWRIPFGPRRRLEMAAYSYRHYGRSEYRLVRPRVIVEHFADTSTAAAVFNTFAPDHPDPELHEYPNTCAHFVVGRDGTIYQLVPLYLRCRHAVGLNHTAIGIEHVGFSDSGVLRNPFQLGASLRLTRWLRCTYGITIPNVIGHAEALTSPYHLERIARLRNQTHGDFARASMNYYRARLARLGC